VTDSAQSGGQFAFLYTGDTAAIGEQYAEDLIERGAIIRSISIAYGPSPAKVAGLPHGEDCWHALIVGEWKDGGPRG